LDMLIACAPAPCDAGQVAQRFGAGRVSAARRLGWLLEPDELCRDYRLVSGEIEITSHCNWRCGFCPVSIDPKPLRTMPMDLFEEIVAKLADVTTVEYVTFQHYNEPTLDKYFTARVEVLARYGMQLALYTNASALTPDKIDTLRRHRMLRHLIVNLPSVDPGEFAELTASRTYSQVVRNLEQAINAGFRVQIVVNGTGERLERNLEGLTRRYAPLGVEVFPTLTCDRAGDGPAEYFQDVHIAGRLSGCGWPVHHANFSVTGDMFLCCNDYYQRETFGNIRDGSIHELMTSASAVRLRRQVFGVADAAADFLCRRCHNQQADFPAREFRPIATFG
jgi:hypothetical protein